MSCRRLADICVPEAVTLDEPPPVVVTVPPPAPPVPVPVLPLPAPLPPLPVPVPPVPVPPPPPDPPSVDIVWTFVYPATMLSCGSRPDLACCVRPCAAAMAARAAITDG